MLRRAFLILFISGICFAASSLRLSANQNYYETSPGKTISIPIQVENLGEADIDITPKISIPEDWKVISGNLPILLRQGEEQLVIVNLYIPHSSQSGSYQIDYSLDENQYRESVAIDIDVESYSEIKIEELYSPAFIIEKDSFKIEYLIVNSGNETETIDLSFSSHRDVNILSEKEEIALAPGNSYKIELECYLDSKIKHEKTYKIEILVKSDNSKQVRYAKIRAIPNMEYKQKKMTYPIDIALQSGVRLFDDTTFSFKPEINAYGALDKNHKNYLGFKYQSPINKFDSFDRNSLNSITDNIFGENDIYSLSYHNPYFTIRIGDENYHSSRVMGNIEGRGIFSKFTLNSVGIGGYIQRDKWLRDQYNKIFGMADYSFARNSKITLSYLRDYDEEVENDYVALDLDLNALKNISLSAEVSAPLKLGFVNSENAYSMMLKYKPSWAYIMGYYFRSGSNFSIRNDNREEIRVYSTFPIIGRMSSEIDFQQKKDNLDIFDNYCSIQIDSKLKCGMRQSLFSFASLGYGVEYNHLEDELTSLSTDAEEYSGYAELSGSFRDAFFNLGIELGQSQDYSANRIDIMEKYSLSAGYFLVNNLDFSIHLQYENNDLFSDFENRQLNCAISGMYLYNNLFALDLSLETWGQKELYFNADFDELNTYLSSQLNFTLPWNFELFLRDRYYFIGENTSNDFEGRLIYNLPLAVPLSLSRRNCTFSGQVIDDDTGQPMPDVMVNLGKNRVITDSNGRFEFKKLESGSYYFSIQQVNHSVKYMVSPRTPSQMEIRPGQKKNIIIRMYKPCSIQGNIVPDMSFMDIENIILELYNSDYSYRTTTNSAGHFEFDDIVPGQWYLSLPENSLGYSISKGKIFNVYLAPGENLEQDISIEINRSNIKIIDHGNITSEF